MHAARGADRAADSYGGGGGGQHIVGHCSVPLKEVGSGCKLDVRRR